MLPSCTRLLPRRYGLVILTFALYYFGVLAMLFQTSIQEFNYPLSEPVLDYVNYWIAQKHPVREPINSYDYYFIHEAKTKCDTEDGERLRMVFLVKSKSSHFDRRSTIRKTWGFERRFSDVQIRTVFVLGAVHDQGIQNRVDEESLKYNDIVQGSFVDNYYNNTIKMMMGITWAVKNCGKSKLYFCVDDDMYVSTKNLLRFTRNPLHYPKYLMEDVNFIAKNKSKGVGKLGTSLNGEIGFAQHLQFDISNDAELYSGYVFEQSRPHRHQSSKWYSSLSEYPYNFFPPYVTAAAVAISNVVLHKFYYGSFYVKHFRFDDIYLSILAKKLNILPVHSDHFYFDKKPYNAQEYQYVVASHGYSDPEELQFVWLEQKSAGNA